MPSFNFKDTFKSLKKSKEIKKTKSINYLINFGLAEFGSALDMLAAAELTHNKKLKKDILITLLMNFVMQKCFLI
jgi:hypothetical protein